MPRVYPCPREVMLLLTISLSLYACATQVQTPAPRPADHVRAAGEIAFRPPREKADGETRARVRATYSALPLHFEANQGQADEAVKFLARGGGYSLFLTATETVLTLRQGTESKRQKSKSKEQKSENEPPASSLQSPSIVRMQFVGANSQPRVMGVEELPGKSNYFVGNDSALWRTNIPTYAKVKYEQVYPGIDLVYYGNQQQVEYDFIVAPGTDPNLIKLTFESGESESDPVPTVDADGDLVLQTEAGEVRFRRPRIYQEIDGEQRPVEGRYAFRGEGGGETSPKSQAPSPRIGFEVAAYDPTKPLVIDPVLEYSTFLGGSDGERGVAIAADSTGHMYVLGKAGQIFVAQINPSGTALVYTAFLGGSKFDNPGGIAVDAAGNAYVTGETTSDDFPLINPLKLTLDDFADAFVAKLNPDGSALVYSTYLGGNSDDSGADITIDSEGNAYVVGSTESTDFPTKNALQATPGGFKDVFLTKIDQAGSSLPYSTYLGGSERDEGRSIAVDAAGNAYVVGQTESTDFPTLNPLQAAIINVYYGHTDAFVSKINTKESAFVYSTLLGGNNFDEATGIAVDAVGNAYVTGVTSSKDFPTMNPVQATRAGDIQEESPLVIGDAFVTKLDASGSALVYSTYLGGSEGDGGADIAVDAAGNAYIVGTTKSSDFPTVDAIQQYNGNGDCRAGLRFQVLCPEVFVAKLNPAGSTLAYSTYLGGDGDGFEFKGADSGSGIAVDAMGNAYVTGDTNSPDFPTVNALQATLNGGTTAFVAKIVDLSMEIRGYLEYPESGPVAGIGVIHGWVFATEAGVTIEKVELFIDGQRADDIPGVILGDIPCCSERKDVQDAFPQFPAENTLRSGWGVTFNWSWLEAGNHSVRVKVTSSTGEIFLTDTRTVTVAKPGDFEFLDQFDLSQATASMENQDVVVNGVMVRDKATQQQKRINTRFRWLTSTQSLGMTQAVTVAESSAWWPTLQAFFASLTAQFTGATAGADDTPRLPFPGVISVFEDPAEGQIVSGISFLRGWTFPEDAARSLSPLGVFIAIDKEFWSSVPCCSGRQDVASAFPDHPDALLSGWGLLFNYGQLSAGPHQIEVQIEPYWGFAFVTDHTVTVVRLGGFEFVDQFDLSGATARIDGQDIEVRGVKIRDKATQQEKMATIRLRWFEGAQGLGLVEAHDL